MYICSPGHVHLKFGAQVRRWLCGVSHQGEIKAPIRTFLSFTLNVPTPKMPVTRSQSQNLTNQRSIPAQDNTEDSEISTRSVEQEQAARGAFVEWLDLDYSSNSILKQTNWKSILKDVHRIGDCRQIAFACPVENPQRLWITIRKTRRRISSKVRLIKWLKTGAPELFGTSFVSQMR